LQDPPEWSEILTYFRGSELQNYFTKVLEDDLKTVIKPQYVDQIPKAVKGTVGDMIKRKAEIGNEDAMIDILGQLFNFLSFLG
jgi:ATP-binding cassette subfamily E protein 1